MNKELFVCLVEERSTEEAFVQAYWARADHLGEAIQRIIDAAHANGLSNPIPVQCDPYDIANLKGRVYPGKESLVFWAKDREAFPPDDVLFELPAGVVASCSEGDHDIDEIEEGYERTLGNHGMHSILVNVARANLLPVYSQLLELQSKYKVFWYLLHDHWDDQTEDSFLVSETLNSPERILDHLSNNLLDSVQNGFVTLTAYIEAGRTNLNISEHKRIAIMTYSVSLAEQYAKTLEALGYKELEQPVSVERGIYHWHYRLPGSRSRSELIRFLYESGFVDWKPNSKPQK